jgi:hypothetical protein
MVELRTDGKKFQPRYKPGECGWDHVWVGEEGVAAERRRQGAFKKKRGGRGGRYLGHVPQFPSRMSFTTPPSISDT